MEEPEITGEKKPLPSPSPPSFPEISEQLVIEKDLVKMLANFEHVWGFLEPSAFTILTVLIPVYQGGIQKE